VYVLVAIVRRRVHSPLPLYTVLQILSVSLFEKTQLSQLLTRVPPIESEADLANQLLLFE
jgi:hypothetical protein